MKAKQKLKSGWRSVKFGDVVRVSKDRCQDPLADGIERFIGLEHIDPEDLRIRRWGNVADGITFTNVFKPGQVLFGKRRAYQRKVAVADFSGVCSGDIYVLESLDATVMLPELLPFICQTEAFFEHAVGTSAGSLSPRTNWTSLANFEFELPPVDEQRRVYVLLIASAVLAEEIHCAIDAITTLRRSLEQHILTSPNFQKRKVGELAKFSSGKGIRVSDLPKIKSNNNPFPVFGGNGISGYTDKPMPGIINPTVVIGRVGQFCGVTSMTTGPCWITDNALYPVALNDSVQPAFLEICLRASNLNRIKLGEYLPLVTQEVVHKVVVPVPHKELQDIFISQFLEIEAAENALKKRSEDANSLIKRSMVELLGETAHVQ